LLECGDPVVDQELKPDMAAKKFDKAKAGRTALSRELILRSTLAIVDSDGLEGLTIRKLAAALGVTPMAIYRHYKNKTEIEDELVDLVVGNYDVTNHEAEDWREWLAQSYLLMRKALCEHPGIIPLLNGAIYQAGNALAVMEKILAVLCRAGLPAERAARLFHTAMAYTIGAVVLMGHGSGLAATDGDDEEQLRQRKARYEVLSRNRYPKVVELAAQIASSSEDTQFLAGLRQIIRAFEK